MLGKYSTTELYSQTFFLILCAGEQNRALLGSPGRLWTCGPLASASWVWGYSTVSLGPAPLFGGLHYMLFFPLSIKLPLWQHDLARTINIKSADVWGLSSIGNRTEKCQDLCTPYSPDKPNSIAQRVWLPVVLDHIWMPRNAQVTRLRAGLIHPFLISFKAEFKQRQNIACAPLATGL